MSKVVRENVDNLTATLTVQVAKEEYKDAFQTELKRYQGQAQIKGFRKGKAPMGFIKKNFGQALLIDLVNKKMQDHLVSYLTEHQKDFVGQPIPSDSQGEVVFDTNDMKDFTFTFDIGLVPQFDLKGVDGRSKFTKYVVDVDDNTVNIELETATKRHGDRNTTEEAIVENDMVKIDAVELEGDTAKEGGHSTSISLLADRLTDDAKKEILGKKAGDTIRFNVNNLEQGSLDEKYIKKYLLNLEEDEMDKEVGSEFEGKITEVTRLTPAEYNQEFFDKNFGEGKVSSLDEAKEFIREEIGKFYLEQTTNLLHRDIQDSIMEKNKFDLPDAFLKKWLTFADEKNTPEKVEEEYPQYAIGVKWSLIREKLEEKFEVTVEEAEIREGMAKQIAAYMQGMNNPEFIESTVNRLMEDQKQVSNMANEIGTKKLFDQIADAVKLAEETISIEEFRNLVQERNDKNQ
jgi:trigger factor